MLDRKAAPMNSRSCSISISQERVNLLTMFPDIWKQAIGHLQDTISVVGLGNAVVLGL